MQSYAPGKVGEDLLLEYSYAPNGFAVPIEAAWTTIKRTGQRNITVVRHEVATVAGTVASYAFRAPIDDRYIVEWHVQHSGGLDKYSPDYELIILPRISP